MVARRKQRVPHPRARAVQRKVKIPDNLVIARLTNDSQEEDDGQGKEPKVLESRPEFPIIHGWIHPPMRARLKEEEKKREKGDKKRKGAVFFTTFFSFFLSLSSLSPPPNTKYIHRMTGGVSLCSHSISLSGMWPVASLCSCKDQLLPAILLNSVRYRSPKVPLQCKFRVRAARYHERSINLARCLNATSLALPWMMSLAEPINR